jgi:hypothetical protein
MSRLVDWLLASVKGPLHRALHVHGTTKLKAVYVTAWFSVTFISFANVFDYISKSLLRKFE